MRNKCPDLFQTDKFFVVHVSPIFLGLCRRSGRIRGQMGENVTPKKILERGSGVDQNLTFKPLLLWSIRDHGCEDLVETRPFYYSHALFGGRMNQT
jgi:hypothetical protein